MSSDSAALSQVDVSGTYLLASTTATQISVSPPGEKFTAFTGELIKLLSAESEYPLLLREIYAPLSAALAKRGLPKPKCSVGDTSGDLVLRKQVTQPTRYESTRTSSSRGGFEDRRNQFDASLIFEPYPYGQYARSATAPQRLSAHSLSGHNMQDALHPLAHDTNSRKRVLATPVRYLVGINACVIGLISFGTLTAGIVETSGGNYNNDGLGAAIFGLIFLFFVVIVCVEALAKAISPKPGLLVSRVWRWICGRDAA
jgi:hypothetical protein